MKYGSLLAPLMATVAKECDSLLTPLTATAARSVYNFLVSEYASEHCVVRMFNACGSMLGSGL